MRNTKKIITVLFSLLLVFLMIPAVPGTAYADEDMSAQEAIDKAMANAEDFRAEIEKANKIPMTETRDADKPVKAPSFAQEIADIDDYAAASFVDGTIPVSGWIAIDSDGDGWTWMYAREYTDSFKSLDGEDSLCATSASYENYVGELYPDNWLVSPQFKVPTGKQLQFFICAQDSDWAAEHYGVYISTSSQTDISSFELLYEETVSSGTFEGRTVDLTAYAGKNVYIAFRHFDCTDMYWLDLDGIGLSDAGSTPVPPEALGPRADIVRVAGKTRYDTSLEVAKQILWEAGEDYFPNAIIATGTNFADALAGSALSITGYAPILLVSKNNEATIDNAIAFITEHVDPDGEVIILGGSGAVPESAESKLEAIGMNYTRLSGANRYATNLQVLEAFDYSENGTILICDGKNWPDAASASSTGYPIMLVGKDGLSDEQKAFLEAKKDEGALLHFDIVGGTGAVTEAVEQDLAAYETSEGVYRMAGANRAETAVMVADRFFEYKYGATFAYSSNYPDCIAGGFLAWFMDRPILYGTSKTPNTTYIAADKPFIEEYIITSAYILGGKSLIDSSFVADLIEPNLM